jgi:hypothetical protein
VSAIIRVRNHPEVTVLVVNRLLNYLAAHPDPDDFAGKLLIVEPHQIRIRG